MTLEHNRSDDAARQACFEATLVVQRALEHAAPLLQAQQLTLDVDVQDGVLVRGGFAELRAALSQLIERAVLRMAVGGELSVTVVAESDGVAFEIADDGSDAAGPVHDMTGVTMIAGRIDGDSRLDKVRHWAATCGGSVSLEACPQGGVAATLRLPHTARRAAA